MPQNAVHRRVFGTFHVRIGAQRMKANYKYASIPVTRFIPQPKEYFCCAIKVIAGSADIIVRVEPVARRRQASGSSRNCMDAKQHAKEITEDSKCVSTTTSCFEHPSPYAINNENMVKHFVSLPVTGSTTRRTTLRVLPSLKDARPDPRRTWRQNARTRSPRSRPLKAPRRNRSHPPAHAQLAVQVLPTPTRNRPQRPGHEFSS